MSWNSPGLARWLAVLVPAAFGALAVLHGQDANWDLYNYHLYNPYAWLHGKLDIDLAPAGAQSYFNPALDLLHYLLLTSAWPRASALLPGMVHGLHFVLLYAIARAVLAELPAADRVRVPLLLALAGTLSANLLAGVGSSMGDATTSVFQLGALLALLRRPPALAAALLGAGMLSGLGTGLKLTNALFAVALCLALLAHGGDVRARLRNALLFGIGALAGFAVTGGFWLVEMWTRFGNPLFPQFGSLFPHPLAQSIGSLDQRWLPRGPAEAALWPFVLSFNPGRVSELQVYQLGWAFCYAALLAWGAMRLVPAWRARLQGNLSPEAALLLWFVVLGFAIWAALFSIYRYLVPLETLLPLVLWVALARLFPHERARRIAGRLLALCVAGSLLLALRTWGQVGWADPPFRVETPASLDAARDTIVIGEQPMAWLGAGYPPQTAFASVLSSFPESPRYAALLRERIRQRGGTAYLVLGEARNSRADTLERVDRRLRGWGVLDSAAGCAALRWVVERTRVRAALRSEGARCELYLPPEFSVDLEARNRLVLEDIAGRIARYGLAPEAASCRKLDAYYGDRYRPYRLCRLRVTASPP